MLQVICLLPKKLCGDTEKHCWCPQSPVKAFMSTVPLETEHVAHPCGRSRQLGWHPLGPLPQGPCFTGQRTSVALLTGAGERLSAEDIGFLSWCDPQPL